MQIDKYQLFYEVVTLGVACGLATPQEWIRNYERSYTNILPYDKIPEVEKILWEFVVPALHNSVNLTQETDLKLLSEWVYKS